MDKRLEMPQYTFIGFVNRILDAGANGVNC